MKTKIFACLTISCLIALIALPSWAASIVGSKHDFAASFVGGNPSNFGGEYYINSVAPGNKITETCAFCHTPHGASSDAAYGTPSLLWNRVVTQRVGGPAYTLYSSATFTQSQTPTGVSLMCLSCHDGVTSIAVGSLLNAPGSGNPTVVAGSGIYTAIGDIYYPGSIIAGEGANIGGLSPGAPYNALPIDLSNDHPVSFPWSAVSGYTDIQLPTNAELLKRLGPASNRRLECSTCHNVHDPAIPPFLAMSNANSAMCLQCHIK